VATHTEQHIQCFFAPHARQSARLKTQGPAAADDLNAADLALIGQALALRLATKASRECVAVFADTSCILKSLSPGATAAQRLEQAGSLIAHGALFEAQLRMVRAVETLKAVSADTGG
jgi:hypothetical protein